LRYCAIAYRGTAGRSEWNHYYRTAEQRQAKIDEFFTGIERHAAWKAEQKAETVKARKEEKAGIGTAGDYSLTATAELVRRTLRETFPKTKFSVRSDSYSGGSAIRVNWTDGPTWHQVEPVLNPFNGADFDGMQDLKTYRDASEWNGRKVRFHVDFVQGQRRESASTIQAANVLVSRHCSLPVLDWDEKRECLAGGYIQTPWRYRDGRLVYDSCGGEQHAQLVYQVARLVSQEEPAVTPELPQEVTEEYINDVVRGMLSEVAE
jgi:hypothetical protein